jgi:hypothetical protein
MYSLGKGNNTADKEQTPSITPQALKKSFSKITPCFGLQATAVLKELLLYFT